MKQWLPMQTALPWKPAWQWYGSGSRRARPQASMPLRRLQRKLRIRERPRRSLQVGTVLFSDTLLHLSSSVLPGSVKCTHMACPRHELCLVRRTMMCTFKEYSSVLIIAPQISGTCTWMKHPIMCLICMAAAAGFVLGRGTSALRSYLEPFAGESVSGLAAQVGQLSVNGASDAANRTSAPSGHSDQSMQQAFNVSLASRPSCHPIASESRMLH